MIYVNTDDIYTLFKNGNNNITVTKVRVKICSVPKCVVLNNILNMIQT